ncbi:MarR family winged helix-turn-helix transcriptional regulator [Streptomyces sp. NPDC048603]|uniref:MarR family winged helix-turn-helix transcriptional regulator n=1 Tax=Streptomyces sp. NPDC048603 TaxID=3365577 RepID=UPI003712A9BB
MTTDATDVTDVTDKENDPAVLARQPVGSVTDAAHREVIAYIRGRLGELGLTQPQYWVIRFLHPEDLSADGSGRTPAELAELLAPYLLPQDRPAEDAEDLVGRGLLTRDAAGRLWLAEPGRQAHARVKEILPGLRAHIHDGIDDADYASAVRVLRRMMRNVGGPTALERYPL